MATLSSLYPDSRYTITPAATATNLTQLHIYNTGTSTVNNGGQCCCWVVPANVVWAKFEIWGGGGSGSGSCCCQQPLTSGGSSPYMRKTTRVVPGQFYNICAGGSTCCISQCLGVAGFPSFVCGGITYPVTSCSSGGCMGNSQCFMGYGDCRACGTCSTGTTAGCDFMLCGVTGASHQTSCGFDSWHYSPQSTYIGGGALISKDYCLSMHGTCDGFATFPGGGGKSAIATDGGTWCGGAGAGGLVIITYR